jgi:SARP family transcriptional regulator, regulator of embCAB operon
MRIQLCGRLVVRRGEQQIEHELPGRQGRLLFAYLAANRLRRIARSELTGALWPGEPPAAADSALRALLSKLRATLGRDTLDGRADIRLVLPADAWIDLEAAAAAVHRAESAVALGDWKRAWAPSQVALFTARRNFLPGEEAPWIDEERHALGDLQVRALECYGIACLGIGGTELAAAERTGRELVRLEPYRESGHRLLMEALAARGNRAEALGAYEQLRQQLREELGVAPAQPTQELHRRLLA